MAHLRKQIRDNVVTALTGLSTLYAGSGGTEGGDDLKGKPKPLTFGKVNNITPVRVDVANAIYQVHDGQIEAIDAVYDNGVVVATADYTNDLTNGRFTLDSVSTGSITADVQGAKPSGSYKSTADQIIRLLVTTYGGLTDPGDLDTASFTALNTANSNVVGNHLPTADPYRLGGQGMATKLGFYESHRKGAHAETGTIGYDPETGIPREAFFSTRAKAGTLLDGLLYDAGVLLSLALQYGTPATALAKSVARLEDGSPASPVGELIDVIVKEVETANQSNSQGAADADVQAEEDQAKEGAWELFTG